MRQHNRAYHTGKRLGLWLHDNAFWLLGAALGALSLAFVSRNAPVLACATGLMFILCIGAGTYYANQKFTKEILTEYDNQLQRQLKRKGFRVIKGGKDK